MDASGTPSVPSVERMISLLELLAVAKNGLTLPELSRRLGFPKSSTHCLLVTLERRAYLRRNPKTHRYMLGVKLLALANVALGGIKLREQAAPFLRALMSQTRLTVQLAILDQDAAVLIEKVEPPGPLRQSTWVGKRLELQCTAVGKCLLAYLPEMQFLNLVRSRGTISSVGKLKEQVEQTRRMGYAIEDEEGEIGCRSIGAPVFDPSGDVENVVAAIGVVGTTAQIPPDAYGSLGELARRTAAEISKKLAKDESTQADATPGTGTSGYSHGASGRL
jgi:DNA-binding IclR family transcriptional regulator